MASDPHGFGKCHYDVGNIIDHAIAAFVSPFHIRQNVRLVFKSKAKDGSCLNQKRCVSMTLFTKEMGHGKPCVAEINTASSRSPLS
jgi:hypothetical protein